jgi:hypothetical protein
LLDGLEIDGLQIDGVEMDDARTLWLKRGFAGHQHPRDLALVEPETLR